ncbi:hypothetical protein PFICI_00560 [Pestalotiopsis fici W106-1]|uniref:Uncharacterized protein n=1 Tax=Pestalotiopsis fici (strain W106-1 / CGMCC3.15140) TaxID=1229662 RepID=W3XML3_PESFW|nr:uncharacterized protein PFICI_00560 [Pestalotiopsis fici W106-1]ETS86732.1 hypothetical protein PFICI_00560 [Pestalotiopsis fici W106-1]
MSTPPQVNCPQIGPLGFEMKESSTCSDRDLKGVQYLSEETRTDSTISVATPDASTKWEEIPEKPKKLTRGPLKQLCSLMVTHVPALTISFALLWQNSALHFWFDFEKTIWINGHEFNTNDILHMLQIAAKLYELLVLLSLSNIALDLYRIKLMGNGLPLGLVTSGYRIGDLSYLKHSGLLLAFRSRAATFAIFIALASLLSIAMGPASAILMIPSTGWWEFHDPTGTLSLDIGLEPQAEIDSWPSRLDVDWLNRTGLLYQCQGRRISQGYICPAYGIDTFNLWIGSWDSNRLIPNISIAGNMASTEIRRWISISNTATSDGQITLATTASSAALEVTGYFIDYVDMYYSQAADLLKDFRVNIAPSNQLYQPLVQSKCQLWDWDQARDALRRNDSSGLPYWSLDGLDCLGDTACNSWKEFDQTDRQVDSQYWDFDPEANMFPIFRWINTTDGLLSAMVKIPYTAYGPPDPDTGLVEPIGQRWWASVCTFIPHWVSSSISLPIRRTNTVETVASNAGDGWNLGIFSDLEESVMITIEHEWADMLNIPVNDTVAALWKDPDWDAAKDPPLTIGILDSLLGPTIESDEGNPGYLSTGFQYREDSSTQSSNIEKVLSLVLVNALSHATTLSSAPYVITQQTPDLLELLYISPVNPTGYVPTRLDRGNGSCPVISSSEEGDTFCLSGYDDFDQITAEFAAYQSWTFTIDEFGYGAGVPSQTLTFALFVVYTYLAVVFTYLLGLLLYCKIIPRMFSFREQMDRPVQVAGWDDLQDIVALSWKSRCPDELQNTGAGVGSFSKVWKSRAMVRVTSGRNLELVINDPGEMERARREVYYS